jgi:hypothetical protein
LDLNFFDPLHEHANVLTDLFGIIDTGLFPSPSSKSESELEEYNGNLATTNGGNEVSTEESSDSVSGLEHHSAAAQAVLLQGFFVSSLCCDRSVTEPSSELLDSALPQLTSPSNLPGAISSHIVSVNSGPPVHMAPDTVNSPSDSPLHQDIWSILGSCFSTLAKTGLVGNPDCPKITSFSDSLSELLSTGKSLVNNGGGASLSSSDESINSLLTNGGIFSSSSEDSSSSGSNGQTVSPTSKPSSSASSGTENPVNASGVDGCTCHSVNIRTGFLRIPGGPPNTHTVLPLTNVRVLLSPKCSRHTSGTAGSDMSRDTLANS